MQFTHNYSDFYVMAEARCAAYAKADPFPHCVIDGFLSPTTVAEILAEFPPIGDQFWRCSANNRSPHTQNKFVHQREKNGVWESKYGPASLNLIWNLNSYHFLLFLQS